MTGRKWSCDGCDTINDGASNVCRLCQRQAGSITATRMNVLTENTPRPYRPPAGPPPRPRTQAPPPPLYVTATPPPVFSPTPRPRPGFVPWVVGAAAVVIALAVLLVGNLPDLTSVAGGSAPSSTGSRAETSAPSPLGEQASGEPCPAAVAGFLPGGRGTAVARYQTDKFLVTICAAADGRLYYDGQARGQPATSQHHLQIPAERTAGGFTARNLGYTYSIDNQRLRVTDGKGRTVLDSALSPVR
ncbi:hypothetical protein [Amycolatopsis sp. H20-H5]|uniref:hypothetical protein n=1 Tax=Amycolatopsis sp. H20-H5 TaxID=3046309 RepID=UPI002DB78AB4|nr:hypothetical protein [Amycolatopsis sp. H20-H5]MEC3975722.1 hypothetical protein [Amycolatopsis sp. H20-H5]